MVGVNGASALGIVYGSSGAAVTLVFLAVGSTQQFPPHPILKAFRPSCDHWGLPECHLLSCSFKTKHSGWSLMFS